MSELIRIGQLLLKGFRSGFFLRAPVQYQPKVKLLLHPGLSGAFYLLYVFTKEVKLVSSFANK